MMLNRRVPLRGLLAALFALIVQLALGATVPSAGAQAGMAILEAPICHTDDSGSGGSAPAHVPDCLVCPLCAGVQASIVGILPVGVAVVTAAWLPSLARPELPPPAIAPPSIDWPPNQPRAPPAQS
jgi:Protein of unknown function (DUF2946)